MIYLVNNIKDLNNALKAIIQNFLKMRFKNIDLVIDIVDLDGQSGPKIRQT